MKPARVFFLITASLLMLFGSDAARAATITYAWWDAEVSVTHPDYFGYGDTIDISLSIDTSTAAPGNTFTFKTYLDVTDSIELSGRDWEYTFISDDPAWNFSRFGVLGDATTPMTHDASGYSLRMYDPTRGEYTWLWSVENDVVVWTLHDVVLNGPTTFALTLERFLNPPQTFDFEVVEAFALAPEPSTGVLLAMGLGVFAAAARKRSTP